MRPEVSRLPLARPPPAPVTAPLGDPLFAPPSVDDEEEDFAIATAAAAAAAALAAEHEYANSRCTILNNRTYRANHLMYLRSVQSIRYTYTYSAN